MKALVTRLMPDRRREKVLVTDWPDAGSPGPRQFKTQTLFSGITNGTERNDLIRGNYAHSDESLPQGYGYQNVGRVIEVGADVQNVRVGDVVYMSADHVEHVVYSADDLLIRLPDGVKPTEAALFGMASVAMRTCRYSGVGMGTKTLIVGAGCIGQLAAQIAAGMGARVTIADLDEARLAMARRIGAVEDVISSAQWQELVPDFTYDVVMDFAGVPNMIDPMIAALRIRGTLMLIAGRSQISYTFILGQRREVCIRQNSHFDNEDLAHLCRLVERGRVDIGAILTRVAPVEQAGIIYDALRDEPSTLLGTVFAW